MIYTYLYSQPVGAGVDIYIADTGVFTGHDEFEGRATWGWAPEGVQMVDVDGHGTHIAGIAAGKTYGVAKKANIIAVKILDDTGRGGYAYAMDGLNYISANARSTGRPSITLLAVSGEYSEAVNDVVASLVANGITTIVSAGNNSGDAGDYSPASSLAVYVVGSSDITNTMARSSNFGPFVDVFAPGVDITSALNNGGPGDTVVLSGTSQAAAHVVGIAAAFLSEDPSMKPPRITGRISALATQNALTGIPPNTDTDNAFVFNNADDDE
jgi:cerevisin